MKLSEAKFRKILGLFPTGVVVVTASYGKEDFGITISSFTSLSLKPPQILFCLSKDSKTMPIFERIPYFVVNILSSDQAYLSDVFARRYPLDWSKIKTHRHVETDCILLSEAVGYVICEKRALYEGGDHKIILGKVVDLQKSYEATPLIRHRGEYLTTQPLSSSPVEEESKARLLPLFK